MRKKSGLAGAMLLGGALFTGLPKALAGQTVSGTVVLAETSAPGVGVFVQAFDDNGHRVRAAQTDSLGEFSLSLSAPGSYQLVAEGSGLQTSRALIGLSAGEEVTWSPVLARYALRPGDPPGPSAPRCGLPEDAWGVTHRLIEEVRKAYEVSAWLEEEDPHSFRVLSTRRELLPETRDVISEEPTRLEGEFESLLVDSLTAGFAEEGFFRSSPEGPIAHAPDLGLILSDSFLAAYCVRAILPGSNQAGLAFEPATSAPTSTQIAGTVWVDGETFSPRRIGFEYRNASNGELVVGAGGEVQYAQLPNGAWIPRKASTRRPFRRGGLSSAQFSSALPLLEVSREIVGASGSDTDLDIASGYSLLWGRITDALRDEPLSGATIRLQGTAFSETTDEDGRYRLSAPVEGDHIALVEHPRIQGLGLPSPRHPVDLILGFPIQVDLEIPVIVEDPELVDGRLVIEIDPPPLGLARPATLVTLADSLGDEIAIALASETGLAAFRGLGPGRYFVVAEASGFEGDDPSGVSVRSSASTRAQLSLGPAVDPRSWEEEPTEVCLSERSVFLREVTDALRVWRGALMSGRRDLDVQEYERRRAADTGAVLAEQPVGPVQVLPAAVPGLGEPPPLELIRSTSGEYVAQTPSPDWLISPGAMLDGCASIVASEEGVSGITIKIEFGPETGASGASAILYADSTGFPLSFHYRFHRDREAGLSGNAGGWLLFSRVRGGIPVVTAWEQRLPQIARLLQGGETGAWIDSRGTKVIAVYRGSEAVWRAGTDELPSVEWTDEMWALGNRFYEEEQERIAQEQIVSPDPGVPPELRSQLPDNADPVLVAAGFYERSRSGFSGRFIVQEERPRRISELLQGVTGLDLEYGPGGLVPRMRGIGNVTIGEDMPGCEPAVYVDGLRRYRPPNIDLVVGELVSGIEVYVGAAGPGEYRADRCGLILIWTRAR